MNLQQLKTFLEADAASQPMVTSGDNSGLLARLNGPHATARRARRAARAAVRQAIGAALRAITGDALARLQLLLAEETFDFGDAEAVAELEQIVTDPSAVSRLQALGRRPATIAEQAGIAAADELVRVEDLAAALEQIPGSFRARYLAGKIVPNVTSIFYSARGAHDIGERAKPEADRIVLSPAEVQQRYADALAQAQGS